MIMNSFPTAPDPLPVFTCPFVSYASKTNSSAAHWIVGSNNIYFYKIAAKKPLSGDSLQEFYVFSVRDVMLESSYYVPGLIKPNPVHIRAGKYYKFMNRSEIYGNERYLMIYIFESDIDFSVSNSGVQVYRYVIGTENETALTFTISEV